MNKLFSFLAGALCGALIGGTTALLLTPTSGEQLKAGAVNRWQTAVSDAQQAKADKQRELELQFNQATQSGGNAQPGIK